MLRKPKRSTEPNKTKEIKKTKEAKDKELKDFCPPCRGQTSPQFENT